MKKKFIKYMSPACVGKYIMLYVLSPAAPSVQYIYTLLTALA